MRHRPIMQRAYERELPGGGFVAIDVHTIRTLLHGRKFVAELWVERRRSQRRIGDSPPIIGTASGATMEEVIRKLLPAAQCNVSIGAALQAECMASRAQHRVEPQR